MYVIQEKIGEYEWRDVYQSNDYEFCLELFDAYEKKYPSNFYRVLEVFTYVWNCRTIIIWVYRLIEMVYSYFNIIYFYRSYY